MTASRLQIVRDEEEGQLELRLQRQHQADDLRLDRHIKRRHRFVGDDERRVQRQSAGDAESLALATAELVWVPRAVVGLETHQREQLLDSRPAIGRSSHVVDDERFLDDIASSHPRVQRRVGVLKHNLHVPPSRSHA
jgi:hypothetical protein